MKKIVWTIAFGLLFLSEYSNATFSSPFNREVDESISKVAHSTYVDINNANLWRYPNVEENEDYFSASLYWDGVDFGEGIQAITLKKAPILRIQKRDKKAKKMTEYLQDFQNNEAVVDCSVVMIYAALMSLQETLGEDEFNRECTSWIREKGAFTIGLSPDCMAYNFITTYPELTRGRIGYSGYIPNMPEYKKIAHGLASLIDLPGDGIAMGQNVYCIGENEDNQLLHIGFGGIFSKGPKTYDQIVESLFDAYVKTVTKFNATYDQKVPEESQGLIVVSQGQPSLIQKHKILSFKGFKVLQQKAQEDWPWVRTAPSREKLMSLQVKF